MSFPSFIVSNMVTCIASFSNATSFLYSSCLLLQNFLFGVLLFVKCMLVNNWLLPLLLLLLPLLLLLLSLLNNLFTIFYKLRLLFTIDYIYRTCIADTIEFPCIHINLYYFNEQIESSK